MNQRIRCFPISEYKPFRPQPKLNIHCAEFCTSLWICVASVAASRLQDVTLMICIFYLKKKCKCQSKDYRLLCWFRKLFCTLAPETCLKLIGLPHKCVDVKLKTKLFFLVFSLKTTLYWNIGIIIYLSSGFFEQVCFSLIRIQAKRAPMLL